MPCEKTTSGTGLLPSGQYRRTGTARWRDSSNQSRSWVEGSARASPEESSATDNSNQRNISGKPAEEEVVHLVTELQAAKFKLGRRAGMGAILPAQAGLPP